MNDNNDVNEGEIVLPEEPSTLKQTTEEVSEPVGEAAAQTTGAETETEESNKGANQRIRELVREKNEAKAEAKSLADKLAEITEPIGLPQTNTPAYVPQVQPGEEITPERYRSDVSQTAEGIVGIRIAQNNATNRIRNESLEAVRKYSQLDPESDSFDKELSDIVTEATESFVRTNPYTASPLKFVDKLMKPYLGSVTKEVEKATENIAKQVSESALRPTSVRQLEKPASEKSLAELEQQLGVVNS